MADPRAASVPHQLVVIGGSTVLRGADGRWRTKRVVALYLHELARIYGGCTWLCVVKQDLPVSGVIDEKLVRVVPLSSSRLGVLSNWIRVLRAVPRGADVLGYASALLRLRPIVPIIRSRARRMAVYLAGDYQQQIGAAGRVRAGLYRTGFEGPMRRADVVIARGRRLAELARTLNSTVVETVPIANLDLERANPDEDERSGVVLYVGKLLMSKGVGDLIDAMAELQTREGGGLTLEIVGDGSDAGEFVKQVRRLGLGDRVSFLGWIENPVDLAERIRRAEVVVVPSSSHPEGVPRIIDEALVLARPVVATKVGGVPEEFISGEVVMVGPGRPLDLAAAVRRLVVDEKFRQATRLAGQQRASRWTDEGSPAQQHARVLSGPAPT